MDLGIRDLRAAHQPGEPRFAEVPARTTAIQAAFQQAFKRAAASLTSEARRAVLEVLRRRERRTLPEL